MKIDPLDWPQISALFDQALDLPAPQRSRFLDELPAHHSAHRHTLERLLADHAQVETQDFLQALPKLDLAAEPKLGNNSDSESESATGQQVGPYRLLRELGRGGMASVWLAERNDGVMQRQVALKLPHPGIATRAFAERLMRERDILAALAHPHIARLYDAGVSHGGQPFIALAYVQGQSLMAHCSALQLSVRERIVLFQQVLEAVQYAHAHLVIHRDLKPSNVLVDEAGQVHLLDFGIAKLLVDGQAEATALTLDAGPALTPDYASPEQIAGGGLSTAGDIYSLGVLLYELLTGARPYHLQPQAHQALLQAVNDVDVPKPSHRARGQPALARALRGDLDTIVLKALKKQPSERYATAQAMLDDLQRHLEQQPVLARPDGAAYRLRRLVGRNRLLFGSATAMALMLVVATAVSLHQAKLAREQARTAQAALLFLEDIFSANSAQRPDPQKARQTTARELLDIGAKRIDKNLADAPQAQLRVASTLARMYDDLDLRGEVVALQRKRVALSQTLFGADDSRVAETLLDLTSAAHDNSQVELATQSLAQAQNILDGRRDFKSVVRAKFELEKASSISTSGGKLDEALAHAKRAVELFADFAPSEEAVGALDTLCHIQLKRGQLDAAQAASTQSLKLAAQVSGGMKNRMAYLHQSAADIAAAQGNITQARQALALALKAAEENSGPLSPTVLSILSDQGYFLLGTAQFGAAVNQLALAAERAFVLARSSDASSIEPIVFRRYAAALSPYGRPEQALQALQTAQRLWDGHAGVDEEALWLGESARAHIELGHFDVAQALITQRAQLLRDRASGRVGRNNETLMWRMRLLLARGDGALAQAAFAELEPEARAKPMSRWALTHDAMAAHIALVQGQWAAAQDLAQSMLKLLSEHPQRAQFNNFEAHANWVAGEALRRSAQAAAAQPFLQRAVELDTALYDRQQSPLLAQAQVALAECELALGHTTQAQALMQAAAAIHAQHAELGEQYRRPLRELQDHLHTAAGGPRTH
jgi:eukaryotic-like serine/threonine-protein kinase